MEAIFVFVVMSSDFFVFQSALFRLVLELRFWVLEATASPVKLAANRFLSIPAVNNTLSVHLVIVAIEIGPKGFM